MSSPLPEGTLLPRHIAIIMDGNGRWAQQKGLPRLAGHRAGTENIRRVVQAVARFNIPFLTLYAFSTENWSRPSEEVQGLLDILREVVQRETEALHREGVRLHHLGRLDRLPRSLQEAIRWAVDLTRDNTRLTLSVAFDYGGRDEILRAVQRLLALRPPPEEVDEALLSSLLDTAGLPDPDLVIRTGGEMRLSNFLLWQSAYSEFYSTSVLWPDFDEEELARALLAYSQRQRKFGGVCPRDGF